MEPKHHKDAAFSHLLHNVLDNTSHATELAQELVNDQEEQLVALQRRFAAPPAKGFQPGQLVRWKPGMQNRRLPPYGDTAIVMEVLDPPVFDPSYNCPGSNLFREPLTVALGVQDNDGDFWVFHMDGRRFEIVDETGEKQ